LSSFLIVSSISFQSRGYVVTMTALVTSSATKRISTLGGAPSPETPGKAVGAPAARGASVAIGAGIGGSGVGRSAGEEIRLGYAPYGPEMLEEPIGGCWVPVIAGPRSPRP
jgi:hypothetical protein